MPQCTLANGQITVDTRAGVQISLDEDAMAALLLLNLGYGPGDLSDFLNDPEQALGALIEAGIDPLAPPPIDGPGLVLTPQPKQPRERQLAGRLAARLAVEPDAISLLVPQPDGSLVEVSVAEHAELVELISERLTGDGVSAGDFIAVSSEVSLESVLLYQAAWEIGAAVVILRPTLPPETLQIVADRLQPKIWFFEGGVSVPKGQRLIALDAGFDPDGFDNWLEDGPRVSPKSSGTPDAIAAVVTTSGSSGLPKLIAVTQRSQSFYCHIVKVACGADTPQVYASAADLSAPAGYRSLVVLSLESGFTALIGSPDANSGGLGWFDLCSKAKVTHLVALPSTIRDATALGKNRWDQLGLTHLRFVSSGAGVLHETVRHAFGTLYHGPMHDFFGMSETAGFILGSDQGSVGTVGGVTWNTLIRIVDDAGEPVPQGTPGRLRVFNEGLFKAELSSEDATSRPLGWFTTGDLGVYTSTGRVRVVGRSHDLIKTRQGEFIAPVSIENLLVDDEIVTAAVVVPLAPQDGIERYGLVVESNRDKTELVDRVLDQISERFGRYALPAVVEVFETVPRAALRKPDRAYLKRYLTEIDNRIDEPMSL